MACSEFGLTMLSQLYDQYAWHWSPSYAPIIVCRSACYQKRRFIWQMNKQRMQNLCTKALISFGLSHFCIILIIPSDFHDDSYAWGPRFSILMAIEPCRTKDSPKGAQFTPCNYQSLSQLSAWDPQLSLQKNNIPTLIPMQIAHGIVGSAAVCTA